MRAEEEVTFGEKSWIWKLTETHLQLLTLKRHTANVEASAR